jgi:hypothetical protein
MALEGNNLNTRPTSRGFPGRYHRWRFWWRRRPVVNNGGLGQWRTVTATEGQDDRNNLGQIEILDQLM